MQSEVRQIVERFFNAIRHNDAAGYATVAPSVYVMAASDFGVPLNLGQARQAFPDCTITKMTARNLEGVDDAFVVTGTLICVGAPARSQTVGFLVDGHSAWVDAVYPGGFPPSGQGHQDQEQSTHSATLDSQHTLDLLVSNPMRVPAGPFSSWTADQKGTVPALVEGTCTYSWTMAHDAPGARFLPPEMSDEDEWQFGLDLCIVGHMPEDWPGRVAKLNAADAVLRRARQAGSALRIPTDLKP